MGKNEKLTEDGFVSRSGRVTNPASVICASILLGAIVVASPETKYPTLPGGAPCGSCIAPAELSWKTVVPEAKDEPGEPLEISGTIYQADGKTPAKEIVLFIYHTDATGYYNKDDNASNPRLRGWMRTEADGRYQFRTIKPAPYPRRTIPAHIHAHLYGAGYSEHWIDDYWFQGDAFITDKTIEDARKQESTPAIVELKREADGVWRGTRDIKLKPSK